KPPISNPSLLPRLDASSVSPPCFTLCLNPSPTPFSSSLSTQIKSASISKTKENPFSSSPSFIFVSIFSLSIFLNSVVSIFDAFSSKDRVGTVLQLQVLSLALLFLLYSALGLLNNKKGDGLRYKPLGAEIQLMDSNGGNFTLDSDDDLDSGIKEEDGLVKEKSAVVELGGNGHASHVRGKHLVVSFG
ncbi:uncharacterized protein, partial [Gossypium hirsutum]|uniref:Uncharacterized protein n=1 Tax=Gossypium hirsutum TaxID=3635 RepID=A0ABM2ZBT0_GOSHI